MNQFPSDIDHAYAEAEAPNRRTIRDGWHRARVASALSAQASTGAHGVVLKMRLLDGANAGALVCRTLWLRGGAIAIAKVALTTVGFGGLTPNEIVQYSALDELPIFWAFLRNVEREGRQWIEATSFRPHSDDDVDGPTGVSRGE